MKMQLKRACVVGERAHGRRPSREATSKYGGRGGVFWWASVVGLGREGRWRNVVWIEVFCDYSMLNCYLNGTDVCENVV